MKATISIIAIIFTFLSARAQGDVEKLLFSDINNHRDSMGLAKLQWDSSAYKVAKHHADYLAIINNTKYHTGLITHDEKIDVENFQEYNFSKRMDFFIRKNVYASENVCALGVPNNFSDSLLAITSLKSWLASKKGHRENVENKKSTNGACAISYALVDYTTTTKLFGKITTRVKMSYAVFVAYY